MIRLFLESDDGCATISMLSPDSTASAAEAGADHAGVSGAERPACLFPQGGQLIKLPVRLTHSKTMILHEQGTTAVGNVLKAIRGRVSPTLPLGVMALRNRS
jgi:hypothetical protein